jgi:predicted RNA-binding Zn-ribbon protein involved in translation (DUF1610 family)
MGNHINPPINEGSEWITPSSHPNQLFCPECMNAPLTECNDWEAQRFQVCEQCGWNNRPTVAEYMERLRTEYQNHPEKYEDWERGIIEEMLFEWDNEEEA